MAKSLILEYAADAATVTKAVTAAVARAGYTLKGVDKENGLVTFETGTSMKSWNGQSMSVHIMEVSEKVSQVTVGGKRNAHGAQMQVYDWGEASSIAATLAEHIRPILGQEKVIAGEVSSGGCFIATAVYGSYEHPSVIIFRRFRDQKLATHPLGRLFIRSYYSVGPYMATAIKPFPSVKSAVRGILESFRKKIVCA